MGEAGFEMGRGERRDQAFGDLGLREALLVIWDKRDRIA